jgi:hypothetical protein
MSYDACWCIVHVSIAIFGCKYFVNIYWLKFWLVNCESIARGLHVWVLLVCVYTLWLVRHGGLFKYETVYAYMGVFDVLMHDTPVCLSFFLYLYIYIYIYICVCVYFICTIFLPCVFVFHVLLIQDISGLLCMFVGSSHHQALFWDRWVTIFWIELNWISTAPATF